MVSRNTALFTEDGSIKVLPNLIKCQILHRITKVYNGFKDTRTIVYLINDSMTRLDLTTSKVDDNVLKEIGLGGSKRLEELHLAELAGPNCTREGICDLIVTLKNIKELSIKDTELVDDYMVALIAKNCPRLQYLNLERCINVTDDAMEFIKDMKLICLNLSYTSLTDDGMKCTEDSPLLDHLEDLSVRFTNISTVGLNHLNWQRIKYIGFEVNDIESKKRAEARKGTGMCWFHRDIVLA